MNRCVICDYTEEEGSALLDKNPSRNNKVYDHQGEYLCDACADAVDENFAELADIDDEVEGS